MDYIKGLNNKQKEAVFYGEGPLLILAGAGSGKTRVVTHRIAHLIDNKGVFPGNILAITFTNKAANEMKERVEDLLGSDTAHMWIGTFHSICVRILRYNIDKIGYSKSFSIYDRDDQITLLKECVEEMNLDKEVYKERNIIGTIASLKDQMVDPATYIKENYSSLYSRNVGELYSLYQKKLKENNALDFDDLILKTVELFQTDKETLDYYQKKFQYIFVDEFQDTNKAQYELIRLLSQGHGNICVVGDDDQCVPEGSMVRTKNGLIPIESLEKYDRVYSAAGRGQVLEGALDKVMKKKYQGPIVRIRTKSGKTIKTTPNHMMFGKLNPEPGAFYVYLMYRKDMGYRIGITQGARSRTREGKIVNGLMVRLNQEQGDKVWILRICKSRADAAYYEQLFSIKYQIPTTCFHVASRKTVLEQEHINSLFKEIDTEANAARLMEDLLLFEEYPNHIPAAVVRGERIRRLINLDFFSGRKTGQDSGWHSHRIALNTSGDGLREQVAAGFPVRDGRRETRRVETERVDYDEALEYAKELKGFNNDLEIVKRARLTEETYFTYMPASHIRPNMAIPIYENGKIVEDLVAEIEVEEYEGYVYDISVPNFRQYICNDILIHNSIYGWRGADITNILNFEKDFPNTKTIKLEQNYRSTQNILNVANYVIQNNLGRKPKKLWTDNKAGEKVVVENLVDSEGEAHFVATKMEELMAKGYDYSDFAILYRTNAQSRVFEEAFMRRHIPYKLVGGLRFYDRREIKDLVAYLRLVQNPMDDISLKRIINVPRRGIGNVTIERLEAYANRSGISMFDALNEVDNIDKLGGRAKNSLKDFAQLINNLMDQVNTMGVEDFIRLVLVESGYGQDLEKEASHNVEARTRLENIEEFISVAIDYDVNNPHGHLEDFLSGVSLLSDVDKTEDKENSVTMLTVHSAKGLEFPVVFMVGMEEGLFPLSRALEDEKELEEERRLCYVAITRAEELLYISYAKIRTIYGRTNYCLPSRFIDEMPKELVNINKEATKVVKIKGREGSRKDLIKVRDYTRARSQGQEKLDGDSISIGTKVRHKKWGEGMVVMVKDRDGGEKELTVAFNDNIGLKRLLLSMAPIEIVR